MAGISNNFQNSCINDALSGKINFLGPKYWILRPEFLELKAKVKKIKNVKNILLIFGGSDPSNFSSKVVDAILDMPVGFNLSLVLGAGFIHEKELNNTIKYNTSLTSIDTYKNVSNVAEMMSRSDVVFASPGLTYFESLAVGTPVLGFHQNTMQKDVFNKHLPTLGLENLDSLYEIIKNNEFIFPNDPFIEKMKIGQGITEIIDQILVAR